HVRPSVEVAPPPDMMAKRPPAKATLPESAGLVVTESQSTPLPETSTGPSCVAVATKMPLPYATELGDENAGRTSGVAVHVSASREEMIAGLVALARRSTNRP